MDVDEQAEPIDDTNSDEATLVVVVGGQQHIASSAMSSNAVDRQDEESPFITVGSEVTVATVDHINAEQLANPSQSASDGLVETAGVVPCENANVDEIMLNEDHSSSESVSASGSSETVITNDASSFERQDEVTATSMSDARLVSNVETNQNVVAEQQEEQQIENAGIDPNYPLVLVQRVSLPTANNSNNDGNPSMDQDNIQMAGDGESSMDENPPNNLDIFDDGRIAAAAANNATGAVAASGDDSEDSDDGVISMSEDDEDEAAILENHNLHDFHNQFVVIRNMIEQTRRSMAEAEANFGPSDMIPRNTLMQRFRRILFILNNRRRRLIRLGMTTPDEENPEGEANAEMEAANEEISNENVENAANDEASMTIEQEEEMNENAVRFDTTLPAQHSYMGPNMSRVAGVNYLQDHQYVKLRLFIHQHVLFPGEVLPFMVHSSTNIIEGDADAQNGIMFGLCFPSLTSNNASNAGGSSKNEQLLYGVTCQIYELGTNEHDITLIKSRALQRFVTKVNDLTVPLEYINSHPRMKCFGYVKILPDIYLPEPLKCMNMGSMNRFRDNTSMTESYRRFQAATTPWPVHVYETHNITTIVDKARTQLAQHKIDTMPSDPTQLSYWLLRNLHLPENMMKSVFLANTVNTRLQLIASTFKEEAIFGCRSCGTHIANCRELFAMSKHGVQSQYCNPNGHIHETNTVYQVNRQNILYSGSPSTDFSWFPGYQWHIIVCKICDQHLGWEFKAVEPNLIPKQFFGISSSSVRVRSAHERSDEQAQTQHAFYNFIRLMNGGVHIEE